METFYLHPEVLPLGKIPIFVRKWGHGPKVLLVHGWLDTSLRWTSLGELLARRYEVWALDLPGFGQTSALPLHDTTLEMYAEILAKLIHHITYGEALHGLLGHSMGGLLPLLLLGRPLLFRQLIVCGVPVTGVRYVKPLTDCPGLVTKCLTTFQSLPIQLRTSVVKLGSFAALRSWGVVNHERRTLSDIDGRAAAVLLKQVCASNFLDQLKPCSANVLVIRGQHDPFASRLASEQLAEKLNGLFYEFQGAHHVPMVQQPNHFYRVIGNFLDKA